MTPGQVDTARLASAVRRVLPSVRSDLGRLARIPPVSADPPAAPHLRASAREVATRLRQAGHKSVSWPRIAGGGP